MPTLPEDYVLLLASVSHENVLQELRKWKTARPSIPTQNGEFDIYVSKEEWETYERELSDSTR